MNKGLLRKILPHVIAIASFFIIAAIFCKPALQGDVLEQSDIMGWKGIAQNSFEYKEKHGQFPLWNISLFSGMPNYLIVMNGKSILPDINSIIGLGLPQPANFFFIACVCFYILGLSLGLRPIIAATGAVAFAFSTYHPIIITAGHITKMFAIAYMPLLLAGMVFTYTKRYWLGLAVTSLGAFMEVSSNHPQINYYFFILAAILTIFYIVDWILKKEWKHMILALGIVAVAALVAVGCQALSLLTTAEYSKVSMRGGKSVNIQGTQVTASTTTGLDTSYAFSYSLGKTEPLTEIMPNTFGGSGKAAFDENSKVVSTLVERGFRENDAAQVAASLPKFWGDQTAGGPIYAGAIICILAIIGFVIYKKPLRWALLTISVLAIMMAWGSNLKGFNLFLFDHLPLYNKFRAPSMTMVLLELTLPIMAMLALQTILYRENSREELKKDFKNILIAVGALLGVLVLLYLAMDYSSPIDAQILSHKWDNSGNSDTGTLIVSALKSERRSMYGGQLLRTLGFMALVVGSLFLYMRNTIKPVVVSIALGLILLIDLLVVDSTYLNEANYQPKDDVEQKLSGKTPIDEQILRDTTKDYRVYNSDQERFSASDYHVSIFHRAIGGYHPAKIRIYQDVMERYLYSDLQEARPILNILNAKYVILNNPQNGQQMVAPNPEAYGSCWLVKNVKFTKNDVEELQSLGTVNLKDTALVSQAFTAQVTAPQWDSASSIVLTKFDNDEIEYTANCQGPQFAVFSEVYYPYGWNAYIDGKKTEYTRADYILRGLSIPSGKHSIRFVFEPSSYKTGGTISYISSYLLVLFILGGLFMAWKKKEV